MGTTIEKLFTEMPAEFAPVLSKLRNWDKWPLFYHYVQTLNRDALYTSRIHGYAHIERVILYGGLIALHEGCNEEDIKLLLTSCSYHDIGRINDMVDDSHGARSAEKVPSLVDFTGEDLAIIQASIKAHSVDDSLIDKIIKDFHISDTKRAQLIAKMLKDADALDRVRVNALDPSYLRFEYSRQYIDFSVALCKYYASLNE